MSTTISEQALRSLVGETLESQNGRSSKHAQGPSYYEVFGVNEDADSDGLAQAYGQLRQRYHPGENPQDPLAAEIVRYLDSAYAVLIDPERRHAYDVSLTNGHSPIGAARYTNGAGSRTNGAAVDGAYRGPNGHTAVITEPSRAQFPDEGVAVEASDHRTPGTAAPEAGAAAGGRRRRASVDRDLTTGSIAKNLWFLAWPQMVSGSLTTLDTILDLIWAGRGFGTRAIAGLGAAQSWSQLVMTARMGLDTSTRAMVARAVGAGDMPLANHVAVQSFGLSGGVSIFVAALGIVFTEFLLRLLGVSEGVVAQGANYMRWQFVASGTMAFMFMSGSVLQAAGDTLTPMKAQIVTRIIHFVLSPVLMFGWGFFPDWGLAGAAIANALAQIAGAGMNFYALFAGTSRLRLSLQGYRPDWPLLGRMVRIGAPASVTGMERALAQVILVGLVTPFGDTALAAYSLTSRTQMIANMGSMGVGQAAGIMVGQNLGAKKPERAKSAVLWAMGYVTSVQSVLIGLIVLFPAFFLSVFSNDAELIQNATAWLHIQAVGFFGMAIGMVFQQSFNTAGDTMVPMLVTLASIWGVQQPLALMLSGAAADWTLFGWAVPIPTVANLGQYGIAWAIVLAIGVRLLIYFPYFIWGPWTKKQVLGGPGGRGAMGMRSAH